MTGFMLALNDELYKLRHRKKYFVMLLIGAAVCVIRWGGSALIARLTGGAVFVRSNMPLGMLPFAVELLVPVMLFMAVTDMFTSEYAADTLKACLLKPVTRLKVLSAKAAAAIVLAAVSMLAMYIVCLIVQAVSGGGFSQWAPALAAYLIDLVPLAGVALLGILINVCLKGPSAAMLLSLAVYAVMKYMGYYVSGSESFLFTSYAKWHSLFLGAALPFDMLIYKIGIVAGSILILFSVSYIIFDKRDI